MPKCHTFKVSNFDALSIKCLTLDLSCLFQKLEKGNNMLLPDSIKVRTREKEVIYSKTYIKRPLKNRQNKDLDDKL